ncbi:MAG: signal peptidase I [Acidobacteria bacterium]|nr:signal peptidase I [Acidobacteriota bacterium]
MEDFVVFERSDVRLHDLAQFDSSWRRKGQFREWVESLAFTIIFVLVFTSYIAQATQVPTESMKPTILVGDHFFLDKLAFPANYPEVLRAFLPRRSIKRSDIVAFKSPTDGSIPFVKRVIGLPGDTVEVRNKDLYLNGSMTDEPYKIHVDSTTYSPDGWTPEELKIRDNYGPVTVPENSYFVMGDNRDNSNDSRYWGFVTRDEIIGKPLFVYWSYESDPYIPGDKSFRDWIESYALIAIHFFDKTRWFRFGTMIR